MSRRRRRIRTSRLLRLLLLLLLGGVGRICRLSSAVRPLCPVRRLPAVGSLAAVRSLLVVGLGVAVLVITGLGSIVHGWLRQRVAPLVSWHDRLAVLVVLRVRSTVHGRPRAGGLVWLASPPGPSRVVSCDRERCRG